MNILLSLLLSGLFSFIFTPIAREIGSKFRIVDHPNHRKIHRTQTPCTGGIAIYLSFFISLLIVSFIDRNLKPGSSIIGLFIAATLLLIVGIYDDKRDIPPLKKLYAQIIVSLFAIISGLKIDIITNPFGGTFYLGWLSIPITLFWFLGFINVMNLIDGIDGLSGGIACIVSFTLVLVSLFSEGDTTLLSILSTILAGTTLTFLRFNFSKRKIFLGDSGSMLLGLLLAGIPIIGYKKAQTLCILIITIVSLGVPIYDTASSIVRRLKRKVSIFTADKEHIHHKLIESGLSSNQVVLILCGTSISLGILGILLTMARNKIVAIIPLAFSLSIIYVRRKGLFSKFKGLRKR
ncbi:MAG: MraY family glycosyltransferase [bacterium]|nr:MraY family glycosyltransferase [bacterium]